MHKDPRIQEPSIRSFTLDYFRGLGADVLPLDSSRHRWTVRLPGAVVRNDRSLRLAFGVDPEASSVIPMGRTSPRWREIMSTCTSARPVAYRHIVSEPISQLVPYFQARLPKFAVREVALVAVETRHSVGFSHRVSLDAPVMAGRREQLHHDLLDGVTGARLDALSERFYSLPSLPVEAPTGPRLLPIEDLHRRALQLVDVRTEESGQRLEAELMPRRLEALERLERLGAEQVNRLYSSEEAELAAKIAQVERRKRETRLPGAIAKLHVEWEELEYQRLLLEERRTHERVRMEAALRDRMAAETARHEVTIETTLVSVTAVTYDEVTYALTLGSGEQEHVLTIRLVPVTDTLAAPPCPVCQGAIALDRDAPAPSWRDDLQRFACPRCGPVFEPEEAPPSFDHAPCSRCDTALPLFQLTACQLTGRWFCDACAVTCAVCGAVTDRSHLRPNPAGRGMICPSHATPCATCQRAVVEAEGFHCPGCAQLHCESHAAVCTACGAPTCRDCARLSGCALCSRLADVVPEHPAVVLALKMVADLGRGVRHWRASHAGGFVLIEWRSLLGKRGRLLLHEDAPHLRARLSWHRLTRRWG